MNKQIETEDTDCHELKFFMNEEECDIKFLVEDQTIPANKWLLRMRSDVFDAMLSTERFKESIDGVIEVEDTKYKVFESMIRFLYTNKIAFIDENDYRFAIDVFICADKYHIKPLMSFVEKQVIKMITLDNMEQMYEFSRSYQLKKLFNALNVYLKDNLDFFMIKSLDEIKRFSTLTDSYLMELILIEKNNEIQRLEKILSELARNCVNCKNRITFSGI